MFNCADLVEQGSILGCDDDQWGHSLNMNVKAMCRMAKAILPSMIENGGGSIINMSWTALSIIGVIQSVAADFVKQGIRCNAICPATSSGLRSRCGRRTAPPLNARSGAGIFRRP